MSLDGDSSSRRVWATLLTNAAYLAGLLTMYRTLRRVSSYPLVVMATDSLPVSSRKIISKAGIQIIDVEHIVPATGQHPGFDPTFIRLNDAWTKLRVFGLTQYDRAILIDSDMIFLQPMDELFDLDLPGQDWIGAAPACVCNPLKIAHYPADWVPANCSLSKQQTDFGLYDAPVPKSDAPRTSHLLNSGLVVLHPSSDTMDSLIHFLNTSPTVAESQFADQDVIAEAFRGRWHPLPWWSNALKPVRAVHPTLWQDSKVRLIHYILDKPWHKRPKEILDKIYADAPSASAVERLDAMIKNSSGQQSLSNYDEVHAWWWLVYDELLRDLQDEGESSGWSEVESFVRR